MNFNDVIQMRTNAGPFAGALFFAIWIIQKVWMVGLGFIIGYIISTRKRLSEEEKE